MRSLIRRAAVVAGGAVVLLGPAGVASAAGGSGTWGTAIEVPGTAALNQGGYAQADSVSCASPGNCSAGGGYLDSSGNGQAFVVSEVDGTWGTAEEVPGTATLNQGGGAWVSSVSCASAGNCSAGGIYADSSGHFQVFVVSEVHGTWGTAEEVPGTAALNRGDAEISSVSCASAGNCSAAGLYSFTYPDGQAFVVSEVHGTWGTAEEVPGTAALNQGFAWTKSVSCASAGNCSAGGFYTDSSGNGQAFVVSEVNGTWGTAIEVPGGGVIWSVSCARAGTCSAGGADGLGQAFVVSEVDGTWGTAEEVPGIAALNQGGGAVIASVSCARAGTCSAGGQYADGSGNYQAFVVSQVNGTWDTAEEVPGTAALNQGGSAYVQSVSCASAGICSAGGQYADGSGNYQAFVISETHGAWGTAEEVPGTAALNTGGYAFISEVSCAPAGTCSAGGGYTDSSGNGQTFVVSKAYQQPGPGQVTVSPRQPAALPGHSRASATCHVMIAGSAMRDSVLPLGAATTPYCLIHGGVGWLLPGYPGLPRR